MILELMLDGLYNIFDILTRPIQIPSFPNEAHEYIESFLEFVETGASILAAYTPYTYLLILFGVVVSVDIGIKLYHLVMWVLRKIPVAGIE